MGRFVSIKELLMKRVAIIAASKFVIPAAIAVGSVFAFFIAVTVIVDTATAPAKYVLSSVSEFFFGDDDTGNSDLSDEQKLAFSECVGIPSSVISRAISDIPTGTDPGLAHGWALYSLAHSDPIATRPPSSDTPVDSTDATTSTADSPQISSLAEFATWWTPNAPTGEAAESIAAIPPVLAVIDPTTDYLPYEAAGLVAAIQLANTERVTMSNDQLESLLVPLAEQCATHVD